MGSARLKVDACSLVLRGEARGLNSGYPPELHYLFWVL